MSNVLLTPQQDDFSAEGYLNIAGWLELAYAGQIWGYQIEDALERIGAHSKLLREKKRAFTDARKYIELAIRCLDVAFDDTFTQVFSKVNGEVLCRTEYVQGFANGLIRMVIIYYAAGDGDTERRKAMEKALLNFKPVPGIDRDGMLKLFKFKY